jgi:hypothetical protein
LPPDESGGKLKFKNIACFMAIYDSLGMGFNPFLI